MAAIAGKAMSEQAIKLPSEADFTHAFYSRHARQFLSTIQQAMVSGSCAAAHVQSMKVASNGLVARAGKKGMPMQTLYPLGRLEHDCDCSHCAVCRRTIASGKWFARIDHGGWLLALCSPLCAELFETNPTVYVRGIETVAWMHAQRARRLVGAGLRSL